jgi:hypothetical protein
MKNMSPGSIASDDTWKTNNLTDLSIGGISLA